VISNNVLIAFAILGLLSSCSSLLYHPTHVQHYDPRELKLEYNEGYLEREGLPSIHYWYFPSKKENDKLVLFFHGNGENLSSHFLTLSWLPEFGVDFVIFDYPGYYKSVGTPTPKTTAESGRDIITFFSKKYAHKKIFLFGHSLGGIIALKALELLNIKEQDRVKGVYLDGTFKSYRQAGASVLKKSWVTWWLFPLSYVVLSDEWAPNLERLPKSVKYFVAHSKQDQVIDFQLGLELFYSLPESKQWYPIEFGPHGSTFFVENDRHRKTFLEFLQ
jgi:pimeloyl-ACP methyl ester carboxylesterase